MFQRMRAIFLLSLLLISTWSQAAFHIVQINEVYSNASGSVQFIEITMLAGGQNFFTGQTLTSTQGSNVNSFTFQKNLANATAGDTVLIGTTGYAALPGVPAPDFTVPNGFIFTSNVTINFAGVDFVTYATIPTDGTLSVNRSGATATNSPRNNARVAGTVVLASTATVPAAPTISTPATTGSNQVSFSFAAGSNGGSAITGFTVTCTASGQTTRTVTGTASPLTVTQLATGVSYACSVTATNAIGTGPPSNVVNVVIAAAVTVAGAPTISSAAAGNGQATITFAAPANTGGASIISYTVTCGMFVSSGPSSPITVTGLSNGTTYSCTVAAVNSAGTGAQSAAIAITPTASSNASITLTSNADVAGYGAAIILTASVVGNNPTGTVSFGVSTGLPGVVSLTGCSTAPLVNGVATCAAPGSFQTVGSRQYRAVYSGDNNNQATSVFFSQTVAINSAVLSLSAMPLPPVVGGRAATLTALVKLASPVGSVSFSDNGVAITGCSQLAVSMLPDATDAAVATCTFTAPTGVTGVRQYVATYSYPAGHVSGRVSEVASFDLRLVAQGPVDYTDMWWTGGTENGWGMSISQHGSIQFNVIFAYDNAGKSLWYVMPGGSFNAAGTVFTGALYLPSSAPFSAYDKSLFAVGASVGSAIITYTSNSTATLAFTINGISATKSIQRQIFAVETSGPNLRTNDLWWATFAEDGWGMNIAQQGRVLFPVWYTYDASGKATFFTAQGGSWNGTVWSGTVFAHTSAAWLGVPYNGSQFTATNVGSIALDFSNASNAVMTYTVNGFTQVKRIERQPY